MPLNGHMDVSAADGVVVVTLSVTNSGADPVNLEFRSGKKVDVVVSEDGTEVWQWSDERIFTQAVETQTLASGETVVYEAIWDDPWPGSYTVEASLAATNVTLVEREPFEVP